MYSSQRRRVSAIVVVATREDFASLAAARDDFESRTCGWCPKGASYNKTIDAFTRRQENAHRLLLYVCCERLDALLVCGCTEREEKKKEHTVGRSRAKKK